MSLVKNFTLLPIKFMLDFFKQSYIIEGRALLYLFLVFLVSFRRVPLQQRREYHVAIKAQDIRTGP
jgi:hypothetical protein